MSKKKIVNDKQKVNKSVFLQKVIKRLNDNDPTYLHIDLSNISLTKNDIEKLWQAIKNNNIAGNINWGIKPTANTELASKIEQKLISNNQNYKYHPNDLIHGLLSSHVYRDSKDGDKVQFNKNDPKSKYNDYLKDWSIHKVITDKETKYYGAIYKNDETKQVVLAHRGTVPDFPNNLFNSNSHLLRTDMREIFGGQIVFQQVYSYLAAKEVTKYVKDNDYNLSVTGHSLGAWLAELSLYFCHKDFCYNKAKVVTFDSPGSVMHLNMMESNIVSHSTDFNIKNLDIVTYLSAPNFVNSCNKHVGTAYRLYPNVPKAEFINKTLGWLKKIPKIGNKIKDNTYFAEGILSITGHFLDGLLEQFNPKTGKPKKYARIKDWPVIDYKPSDDYGKKLIEKIIKNIPGAKLLPDFAISTISKLAPDIGILSIVDIMGQLVNGNINTQQYFSAHEHLESKVSGKYQVKDMLNTKKKFSLRYKGHYKVIKTNPQQDIFAPGKDHYLKQLLQHSKDQIKKSFNPITAELLIKLKDQYKIVYDDQEHKNIIKIAKQVTQQKNNDLTVDILREQISRICEIDKTVKQQWQHSFLERTVKTLKVSDILVTEINIEQNKNFVGRNEEFKKLDQILIKNKYALITGLPGIGKSSLAIEYARDKYNNIKSKTKVRHFDSDTAEKIYNNYLQLAQEFGIEIKAVERQLIISQGIQEFDNEFKKIDKKSIISQINRQLSIQNSKIILIFDNVEKYDDIQQYLTNLPKNVKVLITSRKSNVIKGLSQNYHIKLDPLKTTDSVLYLKKALYMRIQANQLMGCDLIKLVKEIGSKNGCIPYKLNQAAAYLQSNCLSTVDDYIKLYKLGKEDAGEAAIFKILLKKSVKAAELIQYASFLDSDFISIGLIKELLLIDNKEVQNCINSLSELSLVSLIRQESGNGLKLHQLTQESIIKYIARHKNEKFILSKEKILGKLVETLNNLMPNVTQIPRKDWQLAESLYGHVKKVIEVASHNKNITISYATLTTKLSLYHEYILNDYEKTLKYSKKALEICKKIYRGDHPDIANSLSHIGNAYYKLGDAKKSLEYFGQSLEMSRKFYQGAHLHIAVILNNIGESYQKLGKLEEALKYKGYSLEMKKKLYQGDNPDIATSLNSIGSAYQKLGDLKNGLEYLESALKIYENFYKGNHPDIAISLNNIGLAYQELGYLEKGLFYSRESLKMRQKLHNGKQPDPDIAVSLNNVGMMYRSLGRTQDALKYVKQSLEMTKKLHQGAHPDIATCLNNVGVLYQASGDRENALMYIEQSLNLYKKIHHGDHPNIAISLNNVGSTYGYFGEVKKALKYKEQSLEMYKRLYKGDHPAIVMGLNNIGMSYQQSGEVNKSLKYLKQSLEMCKQLYKSDHPTTATSLNNIGIAYQRLGEVNKSLTYLEQALEMRQNLYKGDHPDIANSLSNVGAAYHKLGKIKKSLQYYKQSLEMVQKLYKGDHPGVVNNLKHVGMNYYSLDDAKNALKYYKQALEMAKNLHQGDHSDIVSILNYIGMAYFLLEDVQSALEYYKQSLEMAQKIYKGNNHNIVGNLNNVGVTYHKLGDIKNALKYYKQALEMAKNLHQGDHPNIATGLNHLGIVYQELGKIDEAFKYKKESLEMRQRLYKDNHLDIAESFHSIAKTYEKLGNKTKAKECFEKAYLISCKVSGEKHPNTIKYKKNLNELKSQTSNIDLKKKSKLEKNNLDKDIKKIKLKIQSNVLDKVKELAKDGNWSQKGKFINWGDNIFGNFIEKFVFGNWGVKGYVSEDYLKKQLGELSGISNNSNILLKTIYPFKVILSIIGITKLISGNSYNFKLQDNKIALKNLEIAKMLCFEAISLGIMSKNSTIKDFKCAIKFTKLYSDLVNKIAKAHPEYFVDILILKACNDIAKIDDKLVTELLSDSKKFVDSKEVTKDKTENNLSKIEDKKTESTEGLKIKSINDVLDNSTNKNDRDSEVSGDKSGLDDVD